MLPSLVNTKQRAYGPVYGELPQEVVNTGLLAASYFEMPLKTTNSKDNAPNKANAADAKSRAAD